MCVPGSTRQRSSLSSSADQPPATSPSPRPTARARPRQRYRPNSMVLETQFPTFSVTDFLDSSSGRTQTPRRPFRPRPGARGHGRAEIEFAPRLDFGRVPTQLEAKPDGIVVQGTADLMVLRAAGVSWEIVQDGVHQTAQAVVSLDRAAGVLELRSRHRHRRPDARAEIDPAERHEALLVRTGLGKLDLPLSEAGPSRPQRLVLKSLCHRTDRGHPGRGDHQPARDTLAAIRNWDYRYCWLRDAALTATALARLNSHAEGMAYLDWVLDCWRPGPTRSGWPRSTT